ncbi:MAG TPA: DNA polymerase III subunit gamma/tau, partial [Alphaproteobacteria bacterium]|nr:DNA polymerase III subunit gamma/tau [Alphaproteobacteria bacterium]
AGFSPDFTARLSALSSTIGMGALAKTWQILLKGIGEVQSAPSPAAAAEMVLIRLSYAADLPDPADLVRILKEGGADLQSSPAAQKKTESLGPVASISAFPVQAPPPPPMPEQAYVPPSFQTLQDIVNYLENAGEVLLAGRLYQYVHPVRIEDKEDGGLIEFRPTEDAPPTLPQSLREVLSTLTGKRWMVSVSSAAGEETLSSRAKGAAAEEMRVVESHAIVQEAYKLFPGAQITAIRKA